MGYVLILFVALFALLVAALVALWRWARRRALSFEDRDVLATPAPGQRVEIEGAVLHYVERGRGDALVLLHGLGESTFVWRHNIDELARSFRVVAVDMLGFGYSQRLAEADYSLSGHARRTALLMDHLGIPSAVIVGHSLGGAVAQQMAAEMPDRVRGLVLIDTATPREMRWLGRTRWFAPLNPFYYAFGYHNAAMRRRGFRFLYYDPADITPELVEAYMSLARFKGHEEALARLARDVRRKGMARPDDIAVPAVILWGAGDRLLPASRGEWLRAHLRDARLIVVPEASHQLPEEQPEIVDREITSFAGTLSRRKESA